MKLFLPNTALDSIKEVSLRVYAAPRPAGYLCHMHRCKLLNGLNKIVQCSLNITLIPDFYCLHIFYFRIFFSFYVHIFKICSLTLAGVYILQMRILI